MFWRPRNHACWWGCQAVKGVLCNDIETVGEYLQTWKLKLSTTKTVSAALHLNNKETKRELKVNYSKVTLPFCCEPKYRGVTLDRLLTYRRHLESLHKKLTSRVAFLRWHGGSGWDAWATTFWTATLALVPSTAEQRWADCHILRSRSSREISKLSPSPTIVQKVWNFEIQV